MCEVWEAIQDWFNNNKCNKIDKEKFKEKLLGKVKKVIWYELGEEENPEEVFIRVNIGKIPLTSAELIRAFFLKSIKQYFIQKDLRKETGQINISYEKDTNKIKVEINAKELTDLHLYRKTEIQNTQINFAQQWDEIMEWLRNDEFWAFLFKPDIPLHKRADEFFKLYLNIYDEYGFETRDYQKNPSYYPFYVFSKRHKGDSWKKLEEEWSRIKSFFNKLLNWYLDKETYHLAGFVFWQMGKTPENYKKWLIDENNNDEEETNDNDDKCKVENHTKNKFKECLKAQIQKRLKKLIANENEDRDIDEWIKGIEEIGYGDRKENEKVKFVLFLYNLIKYHNHPENLRFPFDKFKNVKTWSIEHIFAQNIEDIKENIHIEELKNLLKEVRTIIKSAVEGENNNECPINEDCTDENKTKCIEELKCLLEIKDIHNIKNLAVIPLRLNSELKQ